MKTLLSSREYHTHFYPAFYDFFPGCEKELDAEMLASVEAEAVRLGMPVASDGRYPLPLWALATARAS